MQKQHTTTEAKGKIVVEPVPEYIVVSAEREYKFAPFHWRQAIRQYLACLWTKRFNSQEALDLTFPTWDSSISDEGTRVHLCYSAVRDMYEAFGSYDGTQPPPLSFVREESVIRVTADTSPQMEAALARFAHDKQLRVIGIDLPKSRHMKRLCLWGYPQGLNVYEEPSGGWIR